jgi:hypothetical protein
MPKSPYQIGGDAFGGVSFAGPLNSALRASRVGGHVPGAQMPGGHGWNRFSPQQRRRPMITTNQTTETNTRNNGKAAPKLPTHVAKVRHGYGKKATYERIGVAWRNDDGSLYVKLSGTQVASALTLYELEDNTQEAVRAADEGDLAHEEAGE